MEYISKKVAAYGQFVLVPTNNVFGTQKVITDCTRKMYSQL